MTEISPVIQDYVKAVYSLEGRTEGPVGTTALAERLGLTPGSVSAMLRKLHALGLASLTPYHGVQLTEDGRRLALEVLRHHRLIELFLAEQLQIDEGSTVSLESLRADQRGIFVRVSDSDPEMLRFLAKQGICPGERMEVIDKQPFDGPVFVRFDGHGVVLGGRVARMMRVKLDPES